MTKFDIELYSFRENHAKSDIFSLKCLKISEMIVLDVLNVHTINDSQLFHYKRNALLSISNFFC